MAERHEKWYERSLRRHLLDFHIPDWHPDFLSRFDPVHFAECVASEKATAATFFANTHTGLCNYPTKVGKMHANLQGRDILGETINELHKRGIDVVVYYCLLYTDWYWDTHPESRIVDVQGKAEKQFMPGSIRRRRFSTICPNNKAYRDFVAAQLEEICEGYDFEGVYPDMTFWPAVCYCRSCREKYRTETGFELPTIVDWRDPAWVRFQRTRERWMSDFAAFVTSVVRQKKPGVTVSHQSHTFLGDWRFGASIELSRTMDWLCADLYGERYGLSFYAKLFNELSETKPFEHINTWTWPNFLDHTSARTEDQMRMSAFSSVMNHGAMVFIDAVDPVGTIRARNYPLVGRVYDEVAAYEREIGGRFCQDVGIYLSYESCIDLRESGTPVAEYGHNFEPGRKPMGENPHRIGAVNLAKTLIQHHIPFGVVTRKSLNRLSDYQVILLPDAVALDAEEVAQLRAFVKAGGGLYASKHTSLFGIDGVQGGDFQLGDVFGVSYAGETRECVTYVSPTSAHGELFPYFSPGLPITVLDTQLRVEQREGVEVLATVTLPYTDPLSGQYASILTDPPGVSSPSPSIVLNRFGKGRAIYSAGLIEGWDHDRQRLVLMRLLKLLATRPFFFETDAPKSVEATLFLQEERKRFVLNVINYQQELPNIPIHDLAIRVRMDGRKPKAVSLLPERSSVSFKVDGDFIELTLPVLKDFAMLEIVFGGAAAQ